MLLVRGQRKFTLLAVVTIPPEDRTIFVGKGLISLFGLRVGDRGELRGNVWRMGRGFGGSLLRDTETRGEQEV